MDNIRESVESLVAADRLEDDGEWEKAVWQRLQAARQGTTLGEDGLVVEIIQQWPCRIVVDSPELGCWIWWIETECWCPHSRCGWVNSNSRCRGQNPPPWVRQAVEDAAAQAVASILGRL
jgi:hypothetical protein